MVFQSETEKNYDMYLSFGFRFRIRILWFVWTFFCGRYYFFSLYLCLDIKRESRSWARQPSRAPTLRESYSSVG